MSELPSTRTRLRGSESGANTSSRPSERPSADARARAESFEDMLLRIENLIAQGAQ